MARSKTSAPFRATAVLTYPHSDLKIIQVDKESVQNFCFQPGTVKDNDKKIECKEDIRACYSRPWRSIWIKFGDFAVIPHELCHYFCDRYEDPEACDKLCDKVDIEEAPKE